MIIGTALKRSASNLKPRKFPQQPFSYGATSQCCSWYPEPEIIGADLKRSASNRKPTVSATTMSCLRHVSVLSITANAYDDRYWFEEVCFKSEINNFCTNRSICCETFQFCPWQPKPGIIGADLNGSASYLKPTFSATTISLLWNVSVLSMATTNQRSSVLMWKGLLRIWNQRLLPQPFSRGETFQCCEWQPKPMIIGTAL